jgi:hypothetical protein
MLVALLVDQRIEARDAAQAADRAAPYRCPHCGGALRLHKGRMAPPHFAHRPLSACVSSRGESLAHLMAKTALRDGFMARGLRAAVEVELPWRSQPPVAPTLPVWDELSPPDLSDVPEPVSPERWADIMVWSPLGQPVGIELQQSALSLDLLERRACAYAQAGVAQMWLPFLDDAVLGAGEQRPGGKDGDLFVARYSAPIWQRWIHGFNLGELWFYEPARILLWRGHFARPGIPLPGNRLQKGPQDVNGARHASRCWRQLTLWGPYGLEELRIDLCRRPPTSLGRHNYPGGLIAHFCGGSAERRARRHCMRLRTSELGLLRILVWNIGKVTMIGYCPCYLPN